MRIAALHIDSFGIFRDTSLACLPPGLVLIQGDNEAGKSTLLWFVRGMLFGFPDGRSRDPRYLSANGQAHGGRLDVIADNGNAYTISRRGVRGGGELTITDSQDASCGDDTLHRLLGGTTEQLYRNVYAFSLAELHTIDSLQADGVKGAIYGATAGTALLALPQAMKKIEDRLDEVFKPRGHKQAINQRLAELDSITERLRDAFKGIDQYDEACTQLAKTQVRIVETQGVLSGLRSETTTLDAYLKLWPEWIGLQECTAELQDLPLVVESFPEDGLTRFGTARQLLEQNRDLLRELEEKHAAKRREIDGLEIDQELIDQAEAVSVLTEGRTPYVVTCAELPLKRQKREGVEAETKNILRRLGPDWTLEKVLQTDCSVAVREAIRANGRFLDDAGTEVTRAEQDVASRGETHELAAGDEQAAEQEVEQYADLEAVDEKLLRDLQTGRELFREATNDLPRVQAELAGEKARAERGIGEIDARWTFDNVRRFDVSIAAQRGVQEFARRFDETRKALDKAESHRAAAEELLRTSREQHAALVDELEKLPDGADPEEVARQKASLTALKAALSERAQREIEARHTQSRLDDKRQELGRLKVKPVSPVALVSRISLTMMLIAVVVLAVGTAIGSLPQFAILAGALAAVGGFGLVWSRVAGTKSINAQAAHSAIIEQVEQEIAALEASLEKTQETCTRRDESISEHARTLSFSTPPTPEEIIAAEESLERDRDALGGRQRLGRVLRKHAEQVQRREKELSDAQRSVKACEEKLRTVHGDWETHLTGLRLAPKSAVETHLIVFTKVIAVRDQIAGLDKTTKRIDRMCASRDSYLALARQVPSLAPHCDGPAADLLSAVDRFFEETQQHQERLKERESARRALADVRRRVSGTADALQEAREIVATATERQCAAQKTWEQWLCEHGFAVDLSPPSARDALHLVENGVDRLTERRQLDETIARLQAYAAEYEKSAAAVFEALQRRVPKPQDLSARIKELGSELELHKENATRRREMQRNAESLLAQIESARRRVDETAQRITALLTEGNAADEHVFRERGKWHARRDELRTAIDRAESTIRKISGEIDLDALKAKLADTSRQQLEARRSEIGLGVADIENQLNEEIDTKAELTNKIDGMRTADQVARLRTDEERVLAEIRPLVLKWTRHALAKMLLQRACKKFEEEQQPKVVRDAAGFFSAMTCNEYAKIIAPVGSDTIEVVSANAKRKKPEELSRGTTEQLYLALRFGFIRLRAADHERLPVLMDDILVNFDPTRAAQAAQAILELTRGRTIRQPVDARATDPDRATDRSHQVLFFTCHPETVAHFRRHDPSLPVFRLQQAAMTVEMP